jgi:hypothetical protein
MSIEFRNARDVTAALATGRNFKNIEEQSFALYIPIL